MRGKPVHGLVVDPGAASGLMGTDTMREYITDHLQYTDMALSLFPSNNTFSGINGNDDPSIAVALVPLGVKGVDNIAFKTDLIGGSGSHCPGLMPLETLITYMASLFYDILDHHDGVLVLRIFFDSIFFP